MDIFPKKTFLLNISHHLDWRVVLGRTLRAIKPVKQVSNSGLARSSQHFVRHFPAVSQLRASWGRGAALLKTFPLCVQRMVTVQSHHFTPPLTWSGQGHGLQILISDMEVKLVIKFFRNLEIFALLEVPSDSRGSMRWSARCCSAAAEKCQCCLRQGGKAGFMGFGVLERSLESFGFFCLLGNTN